VVIVGRSQRGPARRADLRNGDIIVAVAGEPVSTLADLYRHIQSQGEAGAEVPLTIHRDGRSFDVFVKSGDRTKLFKPPQLH
jgi:S1-C subfamily serine protease